MIPVGGALAPSGAKLRLAAMLGAALLLAASAKGGFEEPLLGTWHVLVHYRDLDSKNPEISRWEDRVWVIRRAGESLEWIDYPMAVFGDESGRFADLGTNRARRLTGRWTPNARQQSEIEGAGVEVSARGRERRLLEPAGPGAWESGPARPPAGGRPEYREHWRLEDGPAGLHLSIRSRLEGGDEIEALGRIDYRFETAREGTKSLEGRYERDGRRYGRVRLTPTRLRHGGATHAERGAAGSPHGDEEVFGPPGGQRINAPLLYALVRPSHYLGERSLEIHTTPSGAELELVYLRTGTLLAHRRGRAPMRVELPRRLNAAPSDRVRVRAWVAGYEPATRSFDVHSGIERLDIDLAPLANELVGVGHTHVAGSSALWLLTREKPALRVGRDGAHVVVALSETSASQQVLARLERLEDPNLRRVRALQLGSDLVLKFELASEGSDLALRRFDSYDPARGLHHSALRLEHRDRAEARSAQLRGAVQAIDASEAPACAAAFEASLREQLAASELARGLAPDRPVAGPAQRAALRRHAALRDDDTLELANGSRLSARDPLEFELAVSRAHEVTGFLATLDELARQLAPDDEANVTLHGLIAPESEPQAFAAAYRRAQEARTRCRQASGLR